jgi:hypothetical protein
MLQTAEAIVAMTTAMVDNTDDEVALFWLPKGAVVVGASISATDMDTNGTPTLAFDVGDTADEDRLIAASQVGRAGTLANALAPTGHLYKYTADTQIKAYVQAAAATAAAGTLYVSVQYFVDLEYSTTGVTATTVA